MAKHTNTRRYIGKFGVDSGQVLIGDPCYLGDFVNDDFEPNKQSEDFTYSYSGACNRTLTDDKAGGIGRFGSMAVVSSTGYGDGVYPVYATYNEDGRIVKLEILFEDDGTDAMEGDDEEEDEDA